MDWTSPPLSKVRRPIIFDEFFESGLEESVSPFLTPSSRPWGKDLPLKASLLSAFFLVIAFALFWVPGLLPLSRIFLILVYFLAGIPSLIEAIRDIGHLEINIDVLMTLAAFLSVLIGSGFEGGLLLVLFSISESIEEAVSSKAKSAIGSLKKLSPTRALVVGSRGELFERSVKDVEAGAHILVKAGEVVPLDGKVVDGSSSVNLVHLTGESVPITKKVGDEVPAGARNLDGSLTLVVTHNNMDSTLAKIIELITKAQEARPKLQRWIDGLSHRYAVSIIALSAVIALVAPWIFSIDYLGVHGAVYQALTFLIAASPCALIIAIPIAYLSAVSSCARQGILLKGGITLDALDACHVLAFDKTGTLTTGDLVYLGQEPLGSSSYGEKEALSIAAALERHAVHPIAAAIMRAFGDDVLPAIQDFKMIPGEGVEGKVATSLGVEKVLVGRPEFVAHELTEGAMLLARAEEMRKEGKLLAALLIGDVPFLLAFRDEVRGDMQTSLLALKARKKRLLMLTGDHHANAQALANELNLDDFYADLRPEDKLDHVSKISSKEGLAMVGDGINDAPALARATVGIAMGQVGSATAIEAADVVLLHDNLHMLPWLFDKALLTRRIVKQNVALASLAICVASLSALFGIIPLWLAVVMHEGGTIVVGLNSLRLLRK